MTLTPPLKLRLEGDAERVRQSHAQGITELQELQIAKAVVIRNVTLPDATDTPISHGLGRPPVFVKESAVREGTPIAAAGIIVDLGTRNTAGQPIDRSRTVVLRATGYGATLVIDLLVM